MERRGFIGGFAALVAGVGAWGTTKVRGIAERVLRDRFLGIAGEDLKAGDTVARDKSGLLFKMKGSRYTMEEREGLIDPTERV